VSILLSLVATAIALVFAAILYQHYLRRGRAYQLVWSVALLDFAIGTFCQFQAELPGGWTPSIYRIWYFTGAMLAAAYLGQGTIYLMFSPRVAHVSMAILGCVSSAGLALVATLPVDLTRAITPGGITGNGFPSGLLILLIPLNTYGTVALVAGAIWSVIRFRQRGTFGRRAVGTLLIAAGGLTVALGGTANRLGVPGLLYVTEMIGLALIFGGYLQTVARTESRSLAPSRPTGEATTHAPPQS
jgi:hypothetical protein